MIAKYKFYVGQIVYISKRYSSSISVIERFTPAGKIKVKDHKKLFKASGIQSGNSWYFCFIFPATLRQIKAYNKKLKRENEQQS